VETKKKEGPAAPEGYALAGRFADLVEGLALMVVHTFR